MPATTKRRGLPAPKDLREPWQIENAKRCGCAGADDMCVCQNDPDAFTPRQSAFDLRHWLERIADATAIPADKRGDLDWLRAAVSLAHNYAKAGLAPVPEKLDPTDG